MSPFLYFYFSPPPLYPFFLPPFLFLFCCLFLFFTSTFSFITAGERFQVFEPMKGLSSLAVSSPNRHLSHHYTTLNMKSIEIYLRDLFPFFIYTHLLFSYLSSTGRLSSQAMDPDSQPPSLRRPYILTHLRPPSPSPSIRILWSGSKRLRFYRK